MNNNNSTNEPRSKKKNINDILGELIEEKREKYFSEIIKNKDEYEKRRKQIENEYEQKRKTLVGLKNKYNLIWKLTDSDIRKTWTNCDLNKNSYSRLFSYDKPYKLHFDDPVMIKLNKYHNKYLESKNPFVSLKFKKFNRFRKLVHEKIQLRKMNKETYNYFLNSSEKDLWRFISSNYNKTDEWKWAR